MGSSGILGILLIVIVWSVKIGLIIFFVAAVRRLLRIVEQTSKETAKQTEILDTLAGALSARNVDTRQDT